MMMTRWIGHHGRQRRGFTMIELLVVISIILVLLTLTITVGTGMTQRSEIRETENVLRLLEVALQEWKVAADREVTWGVDGQLPDGTINARTRYDMGMTTPDILTLTELFKTARKPDTVRERLNQLDAKFVEQIDTSGMPPLWMTRPDDPASSYANTVAVSDWFNAAADSKQNIDGELAILDAWGTPIRVVHPGREWIAAGPGVLMPDPVTLRDEDGTLRTEYELRYGVCTGRNVAFVSAGPDKKFGDLHLSVAGVGGLSAAAKAEADQAADNIYSYDIITERGKF